MKAGMIMYKIMKKSSIIILALLSVSLLLTGCSNDSTRQELFQIKGRVELSTLPAVMAVQDLRPRHPGQPDQREKLAINSVEENLFTLPLEAVQIKAREYIVKFNQDIDRAYLQKEILKGKGQILNRLRDNIYKISLDDENRDIIKKLEENPLVSYIEPEYLVHIQHIPNDPGYAKQWNLKLLNLETVWQNWSGSKDTIVAVIDTGILPGHPDLAGNIIPGYDFIDDDNDPTDTNKEFSHGTHVAGIIGAMTNNQQGIAGINWQVSIMPIRVIGKEGTGDYSALIAGIYWAVDNGANVINLSLAGSMDTIALREAIQYAVQHQVTVVAAAGNNGSSPILYPARYPEVISVGAVGPTRERAYYSNYGPELDLVAPGGDSSILTEEYNTILSTAGYMDNNTAVYQYTWTQGTSMAAPHVSASVALLYSAGITDPVEIQRLLRETADDLGSPGPDSFYGAGLLNIKRALAYTGWYEDDTSILVQAINKTSGEKKSVFVDPVKRNFTLTLARGPWTIKASYENETGQYSGEIDILVPADKEIVIKIH